MNIGNDINKNIYVVHNLITKEVNKLVSKQIRRHIINKVPDSIWINIINDIINATRL